MLLVSEDVVFVFLWLVFSSQDRIMHSQFSFLLGLFTLTGLPAGCVDLRVCNVSTTWNESYLYQVNNHAYIRLYTYAYVFHAGTHILMDFLYCLCDSSGSCPSR